jgi:hypothetical protein
MHYEFNLVSFEPGSAATEEGVIIVSKLGPAAPHG